MITQELADFFTAYYNIDEDVDVADRIVREILQQVQAGLVPPASVATRSNRPEEDLWPVEPVAAAPAAPGAPAAQVAAPSKGWWITLHDDITAAGAAGAFTPQTLSQLTGGRAFATQQEVNEWLQARWQAWFGGPAAPTVQ